MFCFVFHSNPVNPFCEVLTMTHYTQTKMLFKTKSFTGVLLCKNLKHLSRKQMFKLAIYDFDEKSNRILIRTSA